MVEGCYSYRNSSGGSNNIVIDIKKSTERRNSIDRITFTKQVKQKMKEKDFKVLSKEEHIKLVKGKKIVFPTKEQPELLHFTFCKGCKWEHAPSFCPNEHKEDMPKHKDGTFQCGYCAWKEGETKMNDDELIKQEEEMTAKVVQELVRHFTYIVREIWTTQQIVDWLNHYQTTQRMINKIRRELKDR